MRTATVASWPDMPHRAYHRSGAWLSDPVLHLVPGTRTITLPEDLTYVAADGTRHTVPAGFQCDGMTSPPWTWGIIGSPLTARYRRPCILHDWYCVSHGIPSATAHHLLRVTLREGGVSRWRAWLMWRLVAWFGPRWDSSARQREI